MWETAAIGLAACRSLLLAGVVTALHFVIVFAFTPLARRLPGSVGVARVRVTYQDGRGLLREIVSACTSRGWSINHLSADSTAETDEHCTVTVVLDLSGPREECGLVTALSETESAIGLDMVRDEMNKVFVAEGVGDRLRGMQAHPSSANI